MEYSCAKARNFELYPLTLPAFGGGAVLSKGLCEFFEYAFDDKSLYNANDCGFE